MLLRIQLSENEPEEACDEKTLQGWVRSGKVQAHHLIWSQEQQAWIEAKKWPSLQDLFSSSLWNAWDSTDDWEVDPDLETGIRELIKNKEPEKEIVFQEVKIPKKKLPKLPLSAIEPIVASTNKKTEKKNISIEEELLDSVKSQQRYAAVMQERLHKKENTKALKTLAASWNPDASLRDQPQFWDDEHTKKKSFSAIRVGLIVILGLVPLVGYREWFISEATTEFPLEEEADALQRGKPVEKWGAIQKEQSLITLEQELKAALRTDMQEVTPNRSLSDALLIELTYVDLNIQNIVADVLSWKGRRLETPKSAKIDINLNSSGEVDRELALVSLIIAKYTEHYTLEMEEFSVTLHLDGVKIQREIAVSEARNLLLRPGALPKFLETIVD